MLASAITRPVRTSSTTPAAPSAFGFCRIASASDSSTTACTLASMLVMSVAPGCGGTWLSRPSTLPMRSTPIRRSPGLPRR